MISNGGAVSSYVDLWFHFEDLYRIFDTEATGITMKQWLEIRDEGRDLDETWTFEIPKIKSQYHLVRNYVRDG